jgi:hypothetical protein
MYGEAAGELLQSNETSQSNIQSLQAILSSPCRWLAFAVGYAPRSRMLQAFPTVSSL